MTTITYQNNLYILNTNETVLNCLLRHGVDYSHACQAGICQSCLIEATDGMIEPAWQEGLPDTLKKQGCFLACMAKPVSMLKLGPPDAAKCDVDAKIKTIERLSYNVLKIKLLVENLDAWAPGQYLNLMTPEGICRNYSIANIPCEEGYIELHIKLHEHGAMSRWLQETASIETQKIKLRGPFGKCYYYNPDKLGFDIILAGTGTGLAPLIGIIKSALSQKHHGRITLIHGGCIDDDIYYTEELNMLSAMNNAFCYDPCVLKTKGLYPEASIEQRVLTHVTNPMHTYAYVCGPKEITNTLKTTVFLAGVSSQRIFSDPFL